MKVKLVKSIDNRCWYSKLDFPVSYEVDLTESLDLLIITSWQHNGRHLHEKDCINDEEYKMSEPLNKPFTIDNPFKKEPDAGLRFNNGKLRYDLLDTFATEQLVKVFTQGAQKYAPNNWKKGMKWSSVLASLKRHVAAFEKGEDFDKESSNYHMAHAAWNALALVSYYKVAPQFDDRQHYYLKGKRIGLDIDDTIADYCPSFCKLVNIDIPTSWNFGFMEHIERAEKEGKNYDEFMKNLPVKIKPEDIPFEPVCYITNRHVDVQIAKDWIKNNGYPQVEVIQTKDKITAAKEMKLDVFVDDKFETFVDMNNAGILCYLMDAPHNRRYDVGFKRIYDLKELI